MTRITGVIFSIILLDAIFHIRLENGFFIAQDHNPNHLALLVMMLFVTTIEHGKISLATKLRISKILK